MRQTWERKYAKPFLTLKIIILIHLNFFEWLFLVWVFLVRLIFSLWKVLKIFKTSHYIMCVFTKSYPALCDPLDCSPPGFSVHGISQARIQEWAAISFSRGSSQPRDRTWVSWIAGRLSYCLSHQGSPQSERRCYYARATMPEQRSQATRDYSHTTDRWGQAFSTVWGLL